MKKTGRGGFTMTNSVMLKLGSMTFSITTAAYSSFKQQWNFNWPTQNRLRNNPAMHYTGEGTRSIDLPGVIYPGKFGELTFIKDMAELAAKGTPLLMVSGTGEVLNYWCISNISETGRHFLPGGIPRKITFSLKLEYYGETAQ